MPTLFLYVRDMDKTISCDDMVTAINLLGPRPAHVEVWVRDYIPSKQVLKVILKDLSVSVPTHLPRTEVIYMIGTEDFRSIEVSKALLDANIPVFAPGGKRLG